jgi:mannonate dehydratase
MRIADARVVTCGVGRAFVTLKIVTTSGVSGLGDATLNGRELAVAAYLREHVCPLLIGRDARLIEDTWRWLARAEYWDTGSVGMTALGAVDVALWDLNAKAIGVPVHRLLGGAVRRKVRAYAHAGGGPVQAILERVAALREQGFDAVRVQGDAMRRLDAARVARCGDRPLELEWSPERYLREIPLTLERVRAAFPDVDVLHDVHGRLRVNEAIRLARSVESLGLLWLEDLFGAADHHDARRVREQTRVPIAAGETWPTLADATPYIAARVIDHVRMGVPHAGGISALRRVASVAEAFGVALAPHCPPDVSPVTTAATLHLALATPNVSIQEHVPAPDDAADVFACSHRLDDGWLCASDASGLGVDFNEKAAMARPYAPRPLPTARLADGTVHPW